MKFSQLDWKQEKKDRKIEENLKRFKTKKKKKDSVSMGQI